MLQVACVACAIVARRVRSTCEPPNNAWSSPSFFATRSNMSASYVRRVISLCGSAASAAPRSAVHGTLPCGYSAVCASREGNAAERAERCACRLRRPDRKANGHSDVPERPRNTRTWRFVRAYESNEDRAARPESPGLGTHATLAQAAAATQRPRRNDRANIRWVADDGLCPTSKCWPDRRTPSRYVARSSRLHRQWQ